MTFKASDKPKLITSAKALEKLTAPGRYRDPEVKGLYLQIANPNNRSWLVRYQIAGKPRALGLGPFPLVSLKKARELARAARLDLLGGVDPVSARAERKATLRAAHAKALTFAEAAARYYAAKSVEWKTEKQRRQFSSSLATHVFPYLGKMQVAAIDTPDVLRVLSPIWESKPATAATVRARIEKVLAWAQVAGFRSADNPARWRGHLREALASHGKIAPVQHHAALDCRELPTFMQELRAKDGVTARALEFLILTAARIGEATGATWDEINLDEKVWIIPAARMKAKREHRIPLCGAALALLNSLPREDGNPHVFLGSKTGAGMSVTMLGKFLKSMRAEATTHGFRSSFRDWAGDHTEFPREIAEAALAHKVGDATEQAYRRGSALEKRRKLMEAWAACSSSPDERGKVLPLRRAK